MNRQIKFRGKRKDTGEWVYGDLLHIDGGCLIYFGSQMETETPYIENSSNIAVELFRTEIAVVEPESVGQFTGLLDANGKEIYEGDVIDFGLNAVVKYHPFLCSFILDCDNREPHFNDSYSELGYMKKQCEKFVVIGSIHDSPELVKLQMTCLSLSN